MLILAGVSLNAIVGDNGIITNAQNANMKSGMASLEEYLQEKYVEYYEDAEKYASKIDLLSAKMPNLLFKNGSKNYFLYENNVYYLINKASLPEEVRKGLIGGNSSELIAVKNLYDVYGVNPDLTVYYIDKSSGTTYGNINLLPLDKNTRAQQVISGDTGVKAFVEDEFARLGIEVDPEKGITMGNTASIQELTIDGSIRTINSISSVADLTSLKKLTLKDLNIQDLNGLENCLLLEYIFFDNCTISNISSGFNSLSSLVKLKTLYMYLPSTISQDIANNQVLGLTNGLHDAKYTTGLTTFGIFGNKTAWEVFFKGENWSFTYDPTVQNSNYHPGNTYNRTYTPGNLSNISSLSNMSSTIKTSIIDMCLMYNNLTNIQVLSSITKISKLWIWGNSSLNSLIGLENHTDLTYLMAQGCGFSNLMGIEGCQSLYYLYISSCPNLTSLSGIGDIDVTQVIGLNCNALTDISALGTIDENNVVKHKKINRVAFVNSSNLEDVSPLKDLTTIRYLFLDGCYAVETDEHSSYEYWVSIENVVELCGVKCKLPDICYNWMDGSNTRDFSVASADKSLTDNSLKMETLRGKTAVLRLSLKNNASLSDEYLNDILSTMTGMQYLQLYGCNNLTNLTFTAFMPDLKELDIRNTNVTDLSALNTAVVNKKIVQMKTLIINNTDTDFTKMQDVISHLYSSSGSHDYSSWVNYDYTTLRGLVLIGDGYDATTGKGFDFSECSRITALKIATKYDTGNSAIDLSKCENLKKVAFYYGERKYILPSGLTSYFSRHKGGIDDLSLVEHLDSLSTDDGNSNWPELLKTMNANASIDYILVQRWSIKNFDFISSLPENVQKSVKSFSNRNSNYSTNSYNITDISALGKLTGITSCYLQGIRVNNLSCLSTCVSLKDLTIRLSEIADWSDLPTVFQYYEKAEDGITDVLKTNYLTNLTILQSELNNTNFLKVDNQLFKIEITTNALSSVTGLQYCKALSVLNLSTNSIANLDGFKNILVVDEEKTTDPGNPVYKTTLKTLNLDYNPIGNSSIYETDNLEVMDLLKKSGVTKITTTGVVFSS